MALVGKLEAEVEIKAAAFVVYNIFKTQLHVLPNISSDIVQKVELQEGDWGTLGSVKNWDYTLDGKQLSIKEKVEVVDDDNKSITFSILDGAILEHYKSFKATIQVTDKEEGSLVKWTMDYEKLSEEIPHPHSYIDLALNIVKDVEAHHLNPNTTVTNIL
ncbi:kirola [Ziziphus jujuba]|uniref:Kirola n=1 Tax=Ziziphus jujuba TaxID=326968 RepID=A0A6P4AK73_ZIZJJ|nr:kirola [Ziziphus jujuba]